MEKVICALWKKPGEDRAAFNASLLANLPPDLGSAGASGIRINVQDDIVAPGEANRQVSREPQPDATVQCWLASANPIFRAGFDEIVIRHCDRFAAWLVAESTIIPNIKHPPAKGQRTPGWSQLAFLTRPDRLDQGAWRRVWRDYHTRVAIDTQANFEYVQNLVIEPLTDDAPPLAALVEECFPIEALTDPFAFFDAVGDSDKFQRNLDAMMESCGRFIDGGTIDVIPTSQYHLAELVRIGGGSAFFIDSALAVPQLLRADLDYIILDYLAEAAMGLLGRMRLADPLSGYPSDFMDVHIGPFLTEIAAQGVKIVSNAGGVNPQALGSALKVKIAELGLPLKVAWIAGDDLLDRAGQFASLPEMGLTSVNAYLGAFPIAQALAGGADIVITGRVVDSALALGPLIHEFGWDAQDWDRLAAGTVAGHLIECGGQATGGTFTDWRSVEGWADIGSPIAECGSDGIFILTKPDGTGGLVNMGTVAEQLLYEVGDPQCYFVPDVTCDLSTVQLEQAGEDRVRVSGATGYPPTGTLKVCATFDDGWRGVAYQPVIGPAAAEKACKQANALFERGRMMLRARGMADYRHAEAVLIGATPDSREVVLKLVVEHGDALGAQMFAREQFAAISAMAPGTSIGFGTQVQPVMGLKSFLVPKEEVTPTLDGHPLAADPVSGFDPSMVIRPAIPTGAGTGEMTVPLVDLAWARSGEKGETINVGIIARKPAYLGFLRSALTERALARWFDHLFGGEAKIVLYDVPGINAINIVLDGALPGGINASQRLDPAAKSIAQVLLDFPVPVPTGLVAGG